jgi:glyoxylase-like metal-dependent hydrolase (beta-lactamase superfamily II)
MRKQRWPLFVCVVAFLGAAWIGRSGSDGPKPDSGWTEVVPGILRTTTYPAGYALVDGGSALLIDAPRAGRGLAKHGVRKIEKALLSHYHRASCAAVGRLLKDGIPVHAPKGAEEWLSVAGVAKYWKESLPLRNSRTAYLVPPEGFAGIVYDLEAGQKISWRGWKLRVVAAPGHARVQVALSARKGDSGSLALFCAGAMASAGTMWAPYTTDWDHWTDLGLKPAAETLRGLAGLKPDLLLPAHGPVVDRDAARALTGTALAAEDVGFLKSFERFTKQRLGNAPTYRFLAKEQATSNGSKPWSQVSEHLFLTGNTYVLVSRDNTCLMVDPWDKRSADQFAKLQNDRKLGALEVVMFSHAHYDHYDGIYYLPDRKKFEVWTLDRVAPPIAEPYRWRAPFLDARPVHFDRRPKDGDTLAWREYRFRFRYLPGQSEFTMGVETTIDGKRCFFTADNFFHQDMFSGSGGWMGLNRSWPLPYADSARKVLEARPDWVLAEHGGPFEFSAEDFRRRVEWGKASARAADILSPSGNHRHDWDPHRIHVEPLVHKARPGQTLQAVLVGHNPLGQKRKLTAVLQGRGLVPDQSWTLELDASSSQRRPFSLRLPDELAAGRHVFIVQVHDGDWLDGSDAFVAVDVER